MGETPKESGGDETPVETEVQVPVVGGRLFVDLADEPDEDVPLIDRRAERRKARRSLIDEVEDLAQVEKVESPAQGAESRQEETPGSGDEAEESRLAKERKRKGKQAATAHAKRSRKIASVEESIPPPTRVPFAKKPASPVPESDSEPEEEDESEEELNYERTEVWITRELLEAMKRFDDQKRAATYKARSRAGKMAKSGKQYSSKELKIIDSDEEFRACINAIGFEWLLKHSTAKVPVDLAREFFSTFRLKNTTDLDADSITFRLFNEEHEMSIREWSLRMGLFSRADDEEGIWNERMVGAPKHTPGFRVQAAWELVTHPDVGDFKSSYSKASHIEDRILRFAQTFISYNLMGTANSTLTTTDLYFTWCMAKSVKVHLGYWLAQACHQMTGNPARHMYTCHLLGAYLQRNIVMKIAKTAPLVVMCEPPETFSVEYFFNKGLLQIQGKDTFFYDVGDKPKTEPEAVESVPSEEVEELKKEMQVMKKEMTKEVGEMRKELGGLRKEISGAREEIKALRGNIADLAVKSSKQNERMAEAVELMMKMTKWLERTFSLTQQKMLPGPSSEVKQPAQGSSSIQRPLPPPKPVATPSASKPVSAPSASKPLSTRKPLSKQHEKKEQPDQSARKKLKVTRPGIPPQSGSRGGQTQK